MKRIAAIVLPELACELARADGLLAREDRPFAVIIDDSEGELDSEARIDAVDARAWKYGIRPGQTAAEASAFVSSLAIVRLARKRITRALEQVAELALAFGTTASISLSTKNKLSTHRIPYPSGASAGPEDTVWLDVSGCARLVGGEDLLCADLRQRTKTLGHQARIAIADGPLIAQALARWQGNEVVAPPRQSSSVIGKLPIAALPLDADTMSWLSKLGILRIDDVSRLDRSQLAHRLGPYAHGVLDFISGCEQTPLRAYTPPRRIVESSCFEDTLSGIEPLLFILRGMLSRATARLAARGEACSKVLLHLGLDRSFVALQHHALGDRSHEALDASIEKNFEFLLPTATAHEETLLRALRAKLERTRLQTPVTSMTLTLDELSAASQHQLSLTDEQTGTDPQALANLLTELEAWVGSQHLGVLHLGDSHRPEGQSLLVPVDLRAQQRKSKIAISPPHTASSHPLLAPVPTRLLPTPLYVGQIANGALIGAEHKLYSIEHLRLSARIDGIRWWTASPICRDYARAWLHSGTRATGDRQEYSEAWLFVDRNTRRGYLHGWFD